MAFFCSACKPAYKSAQSVRKRLAHPPPEPIDITIDMYTKRIEANPKDDQAYYVRGNCYMMKGDNAKGQADLNKAKALRNSKIQAELGEI